MHHDTISMMGENRSGIPPMIASPIGNPDLAALITDSGVSSHRPPISGSLPGRGVDILRDYLLRDDAFLASLFLPICSASPGARAFQRIIHHSLSDHIRIMENDSINDPRPAIISALPSDSRSNVEKSWKTRTGSSELSTETALDNLIFLCTHRRCSEHNTAGEDTA
jgi:hypothetical protein